MADAGTVNVNGVVLVGYSKDHTNEGYTVDKDSNSYTSDGDANCKQPPGEYGTTAAKEDQYRCYRLAKQACLVGVWICTVGRHNNI